MLSVLNMERSRFYYRKKEGIMIFGISMWGVSIPKLRSYLRDYIKDGMASVM